MSKSVEVNIGELGLAVKGEIESLNVPAWTPESRTVRSPSRDSELDGKFIFLQTRRAEYARVQVARDASDWLIITYMKRDKRGNGCTRTSETIEKRDIVNFKVYQS